MLVKQKRFFLYHRMENRKLTTSITLIAKDLKLGEDELPFSINNEEELINKLTRIVKYLLDHDFERLLSAFYRIDLSEQVVNEILHLTPPENIAQELAIKIVERELLKAEFRLKYQS